MTTYGQEVIWTRFDGSVERFAVEGCATIAEAQTKAFWFAAKSGWTTPKWWQWWRWGDTRLPNTENGGHRALKPRPNFGPVPSVGMRTLFDDFYGQCAVVDQHGNHCPSTATHDASCNGNPVRLCDRCYENYLHGSYRQSLVDSHWAEYPSGPELPRAPHA